MGMFDRMTTDALMQRQGNVSWEPLDPRWYSTEVASMASTFAGFGVSPESARRVAAVFACNTLIAETLGSLPCMLMRKLDDENRERATDHRLYKTLRRVVNDQLQLSPMDFFPSQQMHVGMRGRSVSRIDDDGTRLRLWPLNPATLIVEQLSSGRRLYRVAGTQDVYRQDDVLDVRDLSTDGYAVEARATLAREAIAVAMAAEAFQGAFFKNDATGRLVIKHPGNLSPEKRKEFRTMVKENYAGSRNAGESMLLTHGVDVVELGKVDGAKWLTDPRQFQAADVARFWRVPGFMIGLPGPTAWGGGIEETVQHFIDFTIKPWADRWTQAMMLALLTEEEQDEYYIEFNFNDFVRGNLVARFSAYSIGIDKGILSPNEARVRENMGKRPGGDKYQETPAGTAPPAGTGQQRQQQQPPTDIDPDEEDDATDAASRRAAIPQPLYEDAATRLANAEARELEKHRALAAKGGAAWASWLVSFAGQHEAYAVRVLGPLGEGFDVKPWLVESAANRISRSLQRQLMHGLPDGWAATRQQAVRDMIAEVFEHGRS